MTFHAPQTACNYNHLHVPHWGSCLHEAQLHPELPLCWSLGEEESHSSVEKSQVREAQRRTEGKSSHLRTGLGPAHHWHCCCSSPGSASPGSAPPGSASPGSAPLWRGRGRDL